MSSSVDALIAGLFEKAEQSGRCVTASTCHGRNALKRRLRSGTLVCPRPGCYARKAYWAELSRDERDLHVIKALAQERPERTFAGPTAAQLHGLWVPYAIRSSIWIATTRAAHTASSGRFRRLELHDSRTELPLGVPATNLEQTVFDCLRLFPLRNALPIADSSLRVPGVAPGQLEAYFAAKRGGYRGVTRARRTLGLADGRSGSGGESVLRAALHELGYETPLLQVPVEDPICPGHTYEVDMGWWLPGVGWVYCEFDGLEKRGKDFEQLARSTSRERIRESRITLTRQPILRLGWEDLRDEEALCELLDAFGVPRAAESS